MTDTLASGVGAASADAANATVAVIVCAYADERWDDLRRAVESIHAQRRRPLQTIVVIDHNDALAERCRRELVGTSTNRCDVLVNRYERGLSGARNTGLEAATADIVAFLDDDAHAEPDWLGHLCAPYHDDRVLAVGGAAAPDWDASRPAWFPPEFDWVVGCSYVGLPVERAPVRNVIGCSMSVRRSVFAAVGGFRSDLGRVGKVPLGCEETELCIRARRAYPDGVVVFEPSALVHHRVPRARGRLRYFLARCRAEGLSKARVSALAGRGDALSTERAYVARVLPRAVLRDLLSTMRRDVGGLARAGTIVAGLVTVSIGYLQGRVALYSCPAGAGR